MSKKTNLEWWLKFAQEDLSTVYKKTIDRLYNELDEHIHPGSDPGICPWLAGTITYDGLRKFQAGAMEVVRALKDSSIPRPVGFVTAKEEMTTFDNKGFTSCKTIVTDTDRKSTAIALTLQALREAEIYSSEQISECPEEKCGKVFVQNTLKRKRQYCSTQCRNKANRKKKKVQEKKNGSDSKKT